MALTFKEILTELRRDKERDIRFSEILLASVAKVTGIRWSWSEFMSQYRHDPVGYHQVVKRMYDMVPERFHDRIRAPQKPVREFTKKVKRSVKKEYKRLNTVVPRFATRTETIEDEREHELQLARERALEARMIKNKAARKLNAIQRRQERKLRIIKALVFLVTAYKSKRNRRKLAPMLCALVAKKPAPYKLSRRVVIMVEEVLGRRAMKERAKTRKIKFKNQQPSQKWQREELKLWQKFRKHGGRSRRYRRRKK